MKKLVELEALGALVRLARLLDDRSAAAARHARGQGKDGLEVVSRGQLGCNSIDIWNLRLELRRNLKQGLRTR